MKFARLGEPGAEIPVLLENYRYLDLRPITRDIDGEFLADNPLARVESARDMLPELANAVSLRAGPPIARPSAIFCIGLNYTAHAAESGSRPPEAPILFLKTPNTVTGAYDQVTIPRGSKKTDWEVELGVVIAKRASYLDSPEQASSHIAGFSVANDLSERSFQLEVSGGQWSKGKCAPGFTPLGPWLVTPDELNHRSLALRSFVNGVPRQNSSTADMIFGVEFLIYHLSQFVTLEPGDLLLTGTPEGVALSGKFPYLQTGDVLELEIEGLGRQRQEFIAWQANK